MTGVSERAADFIIDVAEEVWEDEPTAAELDLTRRILAAANLLAQPTADEAEGDEREALADLVAPSLTLDFTMPAGRAETDRRSRALNLADRLRAAGFRRRDPDAGLLDVAILSAIRSLRHEAAEERAAMHERGERLTDYGGGVLDGLDKAWLAGRKAARRPVDDRTHTSVEEWWACDAAYEEGLAEGLAAALATPPAPEREGLGGGSENPDSHEWLGTDR